MEILGLVIPLAIVSLLLSSWAHLANHRHGLSVALFVAMGAFSALMVFTGLMTVVLADQLQQELADAALSTRDGWYLAGMGLAVALPLLPPVRAVAARLLPIDKDSRSDMVGLSVIASVIVLMIWTIEMTGDTEIGSVNTFALVMQAVLLVIISYFGVGGAITRTLPNAIDRLGLEVPTAWQVVTSLALIIPLFMASALGGILTELFQPDLVQEIDEQMGDLTRDVSGFQGALVLGLSAGVGEEMLFRGAIQPRFGIMLTSVLFAVTHVQYGLSFVMLGVFLTSVILGVQRRRMNTTSCMITHAAYNFTAVMLSTAV